MGLVSTEQTVRIIEAVGEAMPDPVVRAEPNMNFWPMLLIAIAPVIILPIFFFVKKALSKKGRK